MQALPYVLPAAAAGLAYLNGRHAFTYDLGLLSSFVSSQVHALLAEKKDVLNPFYVLENQAHSSNGDHAWIIFHGKSWTYKEAYEMVLRYGSWLKSKGVEPGEVVAMDFVNSEVFIWVWFGLWSIGAKPAFINYNLTGRPLVHTIKTSTARLVLVDEEGKDKFAEEVLLEHGFVARQPDATTPSERQAQYGFEDEEGLVPSSVKRHAKAAPQARGVESNTYTKPRKLEIFFFDQRLEAHIASLEPIRPPDSLRSNQKRHDMAMLIYTSGTTGLPKPAIMAWGKMNLASTFAAGWIPLKQTEIMYTSMPLYHSSASVLGVCAVLQGGSTICLSKKFSHKTFWPEIRASKATIIHYVGETLRYILTAPKSPLDKDHNVHIAFGNGLRPDVWNTFKDRFGVSTICEFYAATEAPSGMWNRSTNSFSAGAIGRNGTMAMAIMGSMLALVRIDPESEAGSLLRDSTTGLCQVADWNEPGELLFKLDPNDIKAKFQGYYGNEQATTSKVVRDVKKKGDAYFRTGDLMRWDKEGRWWFVDRLGDTFRWKAENTSTQEVSDAMGHFDAIEEANVYGVLVPRHDGRAGCAAAVFKNTGDAGKLPSAQMLKKLAEHLHKELPAFAVPLFLRVTKSILTTGTNKQQKAHLQKDGIDVKMVEESGDVLYWLRGGTYERFGMNDLHKIRSGQVKL
ncbi:acetyl-CoA synthetase-like protein [Amniculicola lignicola CBS 123094]|uniref:Acetyl-CoA synthetase-like protein n=1 Tax=Amniculicola lignicola CBS 123094 TaxID=1392246 RepID=A0A6A5X1S1_9PLEO|nr:acetyl-CoA synthetase-like protein [Amniculicola lignicola CBS 123094]